MTPTKERLVKDPADLPADLCRPEGSLILQYESENLLNRAGGLRVLDITSGRHVFRVTRDKSLEMCFMHACPALGTRAVSVDMKQLPQTTEIWLCLAWSPDSLSLSVGTPQGKSHLLHEEANDEVSKKLVVGRDGEVYEIGDTGVAVSGFRAYEGGELIAEPAAIEAWRHTVDAIKVMQTGRSDQGFLYEVVQSNAIVTMLVTGFEAYGQKRFQELAGEGINPNLEALATAFPKIKVEKEVLLRVGDETGLLPYATRTGINFQNYEDCKKAFKAAYGLRFTKDAGISSNDVRSLKAAIALRHRVIHISPMEAIRSNPGKIPPEFVNQEHANEAIALFTRFIDAVHKSTLTLRPADTTAANE